MKTYKRDKNVITDETGKQIAVVLATNCSMKLAGQMAAYCVELLNVNEKRRAKLDPEKNLSALTTKADSR